MILAERGKLRMLDPVSLYIPISKLGKAKTAREKGNPHYRFDDTLPVFLLCTGSRARKAVQFSQS